MLYHLGQNLPQQQLQQDYERRLAGNDWNSWSTE